MKKHLSISTTSILAFNASLKTKSKSSLRAACHSSGRVVCAGAVVLLAATVNAEAQYN